MTKAQKKIVRNSCLVMLSLFTFMMFDDWILERWDTLRWPAFVLVLIFFALSKNKDAHVNRRQELNRIAKQNPWIKVYLAIYGIALAIGVNHIISNNIDITKTVGAFELFVAIILLILPMKIIQLKEAYIKAGKKI